MKAHALYEGSYTVDQTKKFIPFDPGTQDANSRKGSVFVHIYPFLIETADELILLDTGLGYLADSGQLMLHENIRRAGFEPDQISKVILSHLHNDHALGLVVSRGLQWELSFPKADHYIQKAELEMALTTTSSSYPQAELEYVSRHARLHLVEGSGQLSPSIHYEMSGGHTPFHQVLYIDAGSDFYFYGGDVMPESNAVTRNYIAKYDFDGRKTRDLRTQYCKQAAEEGWECLFYHDFASKPICRIGTKDDGAFSLIPALG